MWRNCRIRIQRSNLLFYTRQCFKIIFLILSFISTFVNCANENSSWVYPDEVFVWGEIEYAWNSTEKLNEALEANLYKPENLVPWSVARWKDRIFIALPRFKPGVTATLTYANLDDDSTKSPALIPYPGWDENQLPDAKGQIPEAANVTLINAIKIRTDVCGRLWVLDSGFINALDKPKFQYLIRPSLIIFDLSTDQLIKQYVFKQTDLLTNTLFVDFVVDTSLDSCDSTFVYIGDNGEYGIVTYSLEQDNSWRVENKFFEETDPIKADEDLLVNTRKSTTEGINAIALSGKNSDGYRTVYFHTVFSTKEFSVSTKILRNETDDPTPEENFKFIGDRGFKGKSKGEFMQQNTGILFFKQNRLTGINCWNSALPYTENNIGHIVFKEEPLWKANDIMVDEDDNLWALSDWKAHNYVLHEEDTVEYRLIKIKVRYAVAGTPCA